MVRATLGVTEIDMLEVLVATFGLIYALIGKMFSQIQLKIIFRFSYSKNEASFDWYFL